MLTVPEYEFVPFEIVQFSELIVAAEPVMFRCIPTDPVLPWREPRLPMSAPVPVPCPIEPCWLEQAAADTAATAKPSASPLRVSFIAMTSKESGVGRARGGPVQVSQAR